jgi:hypothetical protein
MLSLEIGCVVGSDVAKAFHVVCALEAPSGAIRREEHGDPRHCRGVRPSGGLAAAVGRGRSRVPADRARVDG